MGWSLRAHFPQDLICAWVAENNKQFQAASNHLRDQLKQMTGSDLNSYERFRNRRFKVIVEHVYHSKSNTAV